MLNIPYGAIPEFLEMEILAIEKESLPHLISDLALAIAGEKPFKAETKASQWLSSQAPESLQWVLLFAIEEYISPTKNKA